MLPSQQMFSFSLSETIVRESVIIALWRLSLSSVQPYAIIGTTLSGVYGKALLSISVRVFSSKSGSIGAAACVVKSLQYTEYDIK